MAVKNLAMSVGWTELSAAIATNPRNAVGLSGVLSSASASSTILTLPPETSVLWLPPGWTEDNTHTVADGVAISLWIRDPLYRISADTIRRAMEMEEAAALLHMSETAWKEHGGKSRGWIRKHLEEDLRSRASGGEAAPDAWSLILTTKRAALLMDYICIVRNFRIAMWFPDRNQVTTIPLSMDQPTPTLTPLTQIDCQSGRILLGSAGASTLSGPDWTILLFTKEASQFKWIPPACEASIGSHTVAQLQSQLASLDSGATEFKGNRTALWNRLMWIKLTRSWCV